MSEMSEHTKDLSRCFKRLERSDTSLTRKNARAELWKKLSEIRNDCEELFPLIGENGEAKKSPKAPPPCPFCGIPAKSWRSWTNHVILKHGSNADGFSKCWCGREFSNRRETANHFKGLRAAGIDIKEHVTKGILVQGIQAEPLKAVLVFGIGQGKVTFKGVKP